MPEEVSAAIESPATMRLWRSALSSDICPPSGLVGEEGRQFRSGLVEMDARGGFRTVEDASDLRCGLVLEIEQDDCRPLRRGQEPDRCEHTVVGRRVLDR